MLTESVWLLLQPTQAPAVPTDLRLSVIAGPTVRLVWTDTDTDESGYSIERRDVTAGGSFAEIHAVGSGIETYDDSGPFTSHHVYEYRLTIVGGALNGQHSNTARAFALSTGSAAIRIGIGIGL